MGGISTLLPEGIRHLTEAPAPLVRGITRALLCLGFEEMDDDERPPRKIWHDDDALVRHFDWVKKMRKQKYGDGNTPPSTEPEGEPKSNGALSHLMSG